MTRGYKFMTVKQISVFLENKPGELAAFTKLLSDNGIDIRAINIAEASDFGIIRMIVKDIYNATTLLKDANYICSVTDVLAVEVKDEPGALSSLIAVLGDKDVNVEYMYALTNRIKGVAYMIIRPNDQAKAIAALEGSGMKIVSTEQLF